MLLYFVSEKISLQMWDVLDYKCSIQIYCALFSNRIGLPQPQLKNITSSKMAVVTGLPPHVAATIDAISQAGTTGAI